MKGKFRKRLLPLLSMFALLVTAALYGSDALASTQRKASLGTGLTLCAKRSSLSYSISGTCASGETTLVVATDADVQGLHSDVATLQNRVTTLESKVATLQTQVGTLQSQVGTLQTQVSGLQTLLAGVSRPDPNRLLFSGMNLQLVNGLGATYTKNALGNLIIGYNEDAPDLDPESFGPQDRSGSHNLVVGSYHAFSSYGGLVAGYFNYLTGPYASVTGGWFNSASGTYSSVSGGAGNNASGSNSSVSGGIGNKATAFNASVSGGNTNTASGNYASVSGGYGNTASGGYSAILGGQGNTVSTTYGHSP